MSDSKSFFLPDLPAFDLPALDYAQIYQNRELLEAVLDNVTDGIIIANASNSDILLMNRAARQLRGILPKKTKLKDFSRYWKLYYPDGKIVPVEQLPLTLAFHGQSLQQQEFLFAGLDGQIRYHLINSGPLKNVDGSIFAGIIAFRDITERKQAKVALRESEARFRHIYDNAPVMMHSLDEEGRICNVNNKWLEETGYRREEVIGKRIDFLMTEGSGKYAFSEVIPKFWRDGFAHDVPFQYVRKDGSIISVRVDCTATTAPSGKRISLAVVRLITEAEEAIRSSREWFRKAFNLSPHSMCINHLKTGVFVDINNRFTEALGFTREEILGQTPTEINILRNASQQERTLQILKENRRISNLEIVYYTKAGDIHYALISSDIIALNGDYFVLTSVNDITERKRHEQELAASNERFYKAFHSSPMQMSITRMADGHYIDINDSFLQVTGYEREELIGHTSLEINIWADAGQRSEVVAILEKKGNFSNLEIKYKMKSGEIRIFLVSAEIIFLDAERCLLLVANDITERKKQEEMLRVSEERFSKAFNLSPLPMHIISFEDGSYVDVNDAFYQVTGYQREEALGKTGLQLNLWTSYEELTRMRDALLQNGYIRNLEGSFRRRDGEIRFALFSSEMMTIGGKSCVLTIINDITERKKQEEMILTAEREWQTTFDALPDSILLVDKDDRLLRANKTFFERYKFNPEEVIGKEIRSFFHGNAEFGTDEFCPICELRTRHQRGSIELPSGVVSNFPMLANIEPIFDDNNELIATVQILRDLSALYSAREEAEQERGSLKATLEHMADGVMLFDEKGNVVRANSAAQKLYGATLEQLQNASQGSLIMGQLSDKDGNSLGFDQHPVRLCMREQRQIEEGMYIFERPDEQKLFVSITASPFFNEIGRLSGVVAVIRDITRQQREQERLQQADKLRALGQLASGVAHNFNNALAAVIGYSQLALRKTKDAEIQKHLRVIEQSSKDAARMVERIQNFSRSRTQADEFTTARIVDIVRDAIDITRPRWRHDAEATGITYNVALQWQADKELFVRCEPSELREVFVNIIFNALDAMPAGGDLIITAEFNGETISIRFKDTGLGMSEEVKSRIFDPFFTTKGALGLGLGLSESYRIVERHGGSFDVESKPSFGTTFTVNLPLKILGIIDSRRTSSEMPAYRMRVLVLDDEELVRYALVSVLEELGHEALQASTAEEALELLNQQPFDLVFTDLAMPNMDGIAAAKEIKQRNPQVTLILMSGYSQEKVEERAQGTDFIDGVMLKPFRIDEIQKTLKEIVTKRRNR